MHPRRQQLSEIGKRQVAVPKRDLSGRGHSDAKKQVAFTVLAFAGLEKLGQVGSLPLVGRSFHLAQKIASGQLQRTRPLFLCGRIGVPGNGAHSFFSHNLLRLTEETSEKLSSVQDRNLRDPRRTRPDRCFPRTAARFPHQAAGLLVKISANAVTIPLGPNPPAPDFRVVPFSRPRFLKPVPRKHASCIASGHSFHLSTANEYYHCLQ
jgi:hypothetical protein